MPRSTSADRRRPSARCRCPRRRTQSRPSRDVHTAASISPFASVQPTATSSSAADTVTASICWSPGAPNASSPIGVHAPFSRTQIAASRSPCSDVEDPTMINASSRVVAARIRWSPGRGIASRRQSEPSFDVQIAASRSPLAASHPAATRPGTASTTTSMAWSPVPCNPVAAPFDPGPARSSIARPPHRGVDVTAGLLGTHRDRSDRCSRRRSSVNPRCVRAVRARPMELSGDVHAAASVSSTATSIPTATIVPSTMVAPAIA